MAKKAEQKRRTRVKDLPRKEKDLSKKEQKQVKGGQFLALQEATQMDRQRKPQ